MDRFCRIASASLDDYGHPVDRQSVKTPYEARITASHYQVLLNLKQTELASDQATRSIRLDEAGRLNPGRVSALDMPWRLEIKLCPVDPGHDDRDISELLMVVMLYRLVDICEASAIEWLKPETVLTLNHFLAAFTDIPSGRIRARQEIMDVQDPRFAPIADTEQALSKQFDKIAGQTPHRGKFGPISLSDEEALSLAFRVEPHPKEYVSTDEEDEAQSDIRRLAIWGMTGMLAFLSTPVALSMAAVNLAKGEDFRLNTNVLSLTGLLVMLQSSGALAHAVSYLPL
jgi:hypothetical protein